MARWGGEEFAFAIVGASAESAAEVLDRVRLELSVRLSTSDIPGFTASFGVVDTAPCASLDEAVRLADDALYEAKGEGRNRVVVANLDGQERPVHAAATHHIAEHVMAGGGSVLAALAHDDDPLDG
jgi:hypothetical protein